MVDAGAVVLLVLCVQEPELSLKRVAASALSDIAKHTPELAQAVVDAGLFCHTIHCFCPHHDTNDTAVYATYYTLPVCRMHFTNSSHYANVQACLHM